LIEILNPPGAQVYRKRKEADEQKRVREMARRRKTQWSMASGMKIDGETDMARSPKATAKSPGVSIKARRGTIANIDIRSSLLPNRQSIGGKSSLMPLDKSFSSLAKSMKRKPSLDKRRIHFEATEDEEEVCPSDYNEHFDHETCSPLKVKKCKKKHSQLKHSSTLEQQTNYNIAHLSKYISETGV